LYTAYTQKTTTDQNVTLKSALGGSNKTATVTVTAPKTSTTTQRTSGTALPRIRSVVNAATLDEPACSPGGVALITGEGLGAGSGDHVAVEVDGQPVTVFTESETQVRFECPSVHQKDKLNLIVRNSAGSDSAAIDSDEVAPGIFVLDGAREGYGTVVIDSDDDLVMARPGHQGRPAQPGEVVAIVCTGLGLTLEPDQIIARPAVSIDGLAAEVISASALGNGAYRVDVRIPAGVNAGDRVPITLNVPTIDGRVVRSNTVDLAIERENASDH
jgi:uncharacterized protein (TIGR03437 family)